MITDLEQLQTFLEEAIKQLIAKLPEVERWRQPYVDGEIEAWNHLYNMLTGRRAAALGVCPNCKEINYILIPEGDSKVRCRCGRWVTLAEWESGDQ